MVIHALLCAIWYHSYNNRVTGHTGHVFFIIIHRKGVLVNTERKTLPKESHIFHTYSLSREFFRRTDLYGSVCLHIYTAYTEQNRLGAGCRTDIGLQWGVFSVKEHIGCTGIPHIGQSGSPPQNAAQNIRCQCIIPGTVQLEDNLHGEQGTDSAAAVVDVNLVICRIQFGHTVKTIAGQKFPIIQVGDQLHRCPEI